MPRLTSGSLYSNDAKLCKLAGQDTDGSYSPYQKRLALRLKLTTALTACELLRKRWTSSQ